MPFQLEQKLAWISGATVPRLKVTRDVSLLSQARSLKHLVKARTKMISPVGSETMKHTPQFWWRDVLERLYSFDDPVFQQFATDQIYSEAKERAWRRQGISLKANRQLTAQIHQKEFFYLLNCPRHQIASTRSSLWLLNQRMCGMLLSDSLASGVQTWIVPLTR